MLPDRHRLHSHADFGAAVRRGRRTGRRDIVVHAYDTVAAGDLVRRGGPRYGLIVSKAVGPAVIRHRVARRLRHICATTVATVDPAYDIVIRALPGAASATSTDLETQFRSAVSKLGLTASTSRAS
ncbi:ribonuclease P protein component [Rhodococcus rhodnii]|uniref:Ribonuclease P protein component n=2 Tax=Rhodococcus rhodnii TaxID=38312 RepID=R7WK48_9NOCA|nr:ribonuclease P protein component [Rhodococcus rhodnii]EOM75677.1 ribonuclease P [Rhodococcus rhodnii LMG 5362]TXG89673.1 ribonuclease P protein component [Rhodococcus rhodnii]